MASLNVFEGERVERGDVISDGPERRTTFCVCVVFMLLLVTSLRSTGRIPSAGR